MWWRIISRSFRNRKARLLLSVLSVVLGASLVAALTSLSLDIPMKAGAQLRAYGANLLLLPQIPPGASEAYISESDLPFLAQGETAPAIANYAPYLYSLVEIAGQPLVLAGTWLDVVPHLSPWWQVAGYWPEGRENMAEALVGARVAEKLGLGLGREFTVRSGDNARTFKIAGVVSTGAAEENQVFVSLKAVQELTGRQGKVGLVQVSALTQSHPLAHLAQFMEEGMPGTAVRILEQIAQAESQVLGKVQLLLALVAGLILITAGLVILSTMTTTLLERTIEIGLMKALGASPRRIVGLFGAEIGIVAVGGGLLGYLLGYILAQFIGYRVFASAISLRPLAFLVTIAIAAMVTGLGSMLPLRRAVQIDPAITLRGD